MREQSQFERGIRYWMQEVVKQAEKAQGDLRPETVHDLRVAIRRCRSIAEGFSAIDPDRTWKRLRKAAKPLFSALGDLRDVQVQIKWVEKLDLTDSPVSKKLLEYFHIREDQLKNTAATALASFDTGLWQDWARILAERSGQIPPGSEVFQVVALERWTSARDLHAPALRNYSKAALHSLRIGLKKFRYIVENFLPEQHEQWLKELKKLQDLLGDIHDLDVLWDTARGIRAFANPREREQWLSLQKRERQERVDQYRAMMVGPDSLWMRWRRGLPEGEALRSAVFRYFETWAFLRDSDVSHTHRVLESSMAIYDALLGSGLLRTGQLAGIPLRDMLRIAALTRTSAGASKAADRKRLVKQLQALTPPPGWTPLHLVVTALVGRYHRGSLPSPSHSRYSRLRQTARNHVNLLAGILRLAEVLDREAVRLRVTVADRRMELQVSDYQERTREAERISRMRHLLESVLQIAIIIRADVTPAFPAENPN